MAWRERLRIYLPMGEAKRARLGELVFDASPHPSETWEARVHMWSPIVMGWVGIAAALFVLPERWWIPYLVLLPMAGLSWFRYAQYPSQDVRLYQHGVLATFGNAGRRKLLRGSVKIALRYDEIEAIEWRETDELVLTVSKKNQLRSPRLVAYVPESRRAETARLLPLLVANAQARGGSPGAVSRPLVTEERIGR